MFELKPSFKGFTVHKHRKVSAACQRALSILTDDSFRRRVLTIEKFDMTDVGGQRILELLDSFQGEVIVRGYRSWWWSKALAKVKSKEPRVIYLNTRRLNRGIESICGSIVHELIHVLDHHSAERFGHGGNKSAGKRLTAPYLLGSMAKSFVFADGVL